MYERFTDRARKVMQLANQEAQRLDHEYIGTEHILLGLVREGSGVAVAVLKNLGVEPRTITQEVERLIQKDSPCGVSVTGTNPQTPRAKRIIEYAMEESRNLNHAFVGTEHILLGLLRDDLGLAVQVLMNLGLRLEKVRAEIRATLEPSEDQGSTAYSPQWPFTDPKNVAVITLKSITMGGSPILYVSHDTATYPTVKDSLPTPMTRRRRPPPVWRGSRAGPRPANTITTKAKGDGLTQVSTASTRRANCVLVAAAIRSMILALAEWMPASAVVIGAVHRMCRCPTQTPRQCPAH
jgi:hypothetical protein